MDIPTLVNKGYKEAAFKYKRNADKFMSAWRKKGYYCESLTSSGSVVDLEGQPYVRNAYYCICQKEAPKFTKKEERYFAEINRLEDLAINHPKKYWESTKKQFMIHGDPEIRDLIIELNNNNQFTYESCAGHSKKDRGIIFFDARNLDGWKVRAIMQKHGLKNITRERSYPSGFGVPTIIYRFDPVGKAK